MPEFPPLWYLVFAALADGTGQATGAWAFRVAAAALLVMALIQAASVMLAEWDRRARQREARRPWENHP